MALAYGRNQRAYSLFRVVHKVILIRNHPFETSVSSAANFSYCLRVFRSLTNLCQSAQSVVDYFSLCLRVLVVLKIRVNLCQSVVKKLFTKIPCPPQADKSVSKKISVFSVSSVAKQNTVFIRVNLCQTSQC
jgi:hypothetical protein